MKTEILFIERCLALLRPGAGGDRLARRHLQQSFVGLRARFCEDRPRIRAVVSLPQQTFLSSQRKRQGIASVLQKFTDEEPIKFNRKYTNARSEVEAKYTRRSVQKNRLNDAIETAKKAININSVETFQRGLR